jgi:hypothetical protein
MRRPTSKLYFSPAGEARLYDREIAAELGIEAAAVFQRIVFAGFDSRDGWVGKSGEALAAEVPLPNKMAAHRALDVLVEEGMLERDDSRKTHRYRVDHEGAAERFPHRPRNPMKPDSVTNASSQDVTKLDRNASGEAKSPLAPAPARPDEKREEETREDHYHNMHVSGGGEDTSENESKPGGAPPACDPLPEPLSENDGDEEGEYVDTRKATEALKARLGWK